MSLEMALLGLCELALSFLVIYWDAGVPGVLPALVEARCRARGMRRRRNAVNLAAVLALHHRGAPQPPSASIGREICIERRRLLINAGVAGLLAFPAVLVVSGSFHIGFSRHAVLWLAKVLLVWLVCIVASRRDLQPRSCASVGSSGGSWCLGRLRDGAAAPLGDRGGRGRLFEPVTAPRDAGGGGSGQRAHAGRRCGTRRIWGIVVARDPADTPTVPVNALLDCKLRGVPGVRRGRFCEQHLGRIDLDDIRADWLLFADGFAGRRASDVRRSASSTSASASSCCC